ncbi:MAG: hypothetical protein COS29_03025 [Candidatus Omnitrophica bacterium CG02_land_8_20_14_3_00__42_8]|nr:MAG: hypothetical protein COS29_03025 [Candidatus Omnitrophica bacterium CG02_land_8_20_14_3_00__42_8]
MFFKLNFCLDFLYGRGIINLYMRWIKYKRYFISKTAVFFTAVFFIASGIASASISSSKNYKLYTALADGGGASGASKSYNTENSVGYPLDTNVITGPSYKLYGGMLSTRNIISEVTIMSHNDGQAVFENPPTLKWMVTDKDKDPQRYYQVQVSRDNFKTMDADSGVVKSGTQEYTTPILLTTEGYIDYKWRVRVSDGYDYSGWKVATNGFKLAIGKVDVPIIFAQTAPGGKDIPAKLWQECGDPYMYWEYPGQGAQPVGYSYVWGDMPDNQADTTGYFYQTPSDLLGDGIRVFNIKAENSAGNWGETASFEIWIDRGSPVIGNYSPSKGSILATDKPTITISASDDKSGVNPDAINMRINKSSLNAAYDDKTQTITYIPSIPLSEGDTVVSLEVSDFVGNKTSQLVWSFTVDTKGPAGYIIINNQDAVTNSVYVNLALDASDSTTEVQSMVISNDGVFDTEQWEALKTKKENWALTPISGTRKVYVKFRDMAGNESEIFNDTIELIIVAPDTIITSGPSLLTKSREALFTFKGSVEACVFRWKFDDEEWSDWSKDMSVTRKDLEEGNHYFKVQSAKDVNKNSKIDLDETDPSPAERTWTVSEKGVVKPEPEKKKPFKFWKEE